MLLLLPLLLPNLPLKYLSTADKMANLGQSCLLQHDQSLVPAHYLLPAALAAEGPVHWGSGTQWLLVGLVCCSV
jgi:hypothetical protein